MKKLVLAGLTCAGLIALLPEAGLCHGGQYRGPGDVVPPSPGGGRGTGGPSGPTTGGPAGPTTPGPSGPTTPGPSGPTTGGPAGPGAARGPTTGSRGVVLDDDPTRWEFWWEFNKDPFIRLKSAIHSGTVQTGSDDFFLGNTRHVESKDTMKPSSEDIQNTILPALKKAIDATDHRDIVSSCMVAMAKIGKDHPDFKLADVFTPRLKSKDQEISEAAALSFGIAALPHEASVKMLMDLAKDTDAGRRACDRAEVNERTRTFATYGLGLIAYANSTVELKANVFAVLRDILGDEKVSARQMKVAAINAIGLLNVSGTSDAEKALVSDALKSLTDYYGRELGSGEQLIQSHCPPAIAKLIGRDHEKTAEYKKMFADDLAEKGKVKRNSNDIPRSCALALGQLCKAVENDKDEDAKYCTLLLNTFHDHKDAQTRYFSVLALGQIGGTLNHDVLIKEFEKAKKLERPWVAMAMGVYSFKQFDAAQREKGVTAEMDRGFGEALRGGLEEKAVSTLTGVAVGLGLCRYTAAADAIRDLLKKHKNDADIAGYLCIALALMNDQASTLDIRNLVQNSVRKPDLLKQAAVALGKLGDKGVADELQKLMTEGDQNLAKLSAIASALGFIGDRRSIEPLKSMLFDDKIVPLSRAFAAVALGGVADKEDLPWNSKIGCNLNYRAAVETLTDKTSGILDIL